MEREDDVRALMAKLMQAVEASLATSAAVREALAELMRRGYEARLFFVANAESAEGDGAGSGDDGENVGTDELTLPVREIGAAPEAGELRFELTKPDHDFLRSLHIRPESG